MTSRSQHRARGLPALAALLPLLALPAPSLAGGLEMMAEQYIGKFTVYGVEGEPALADEAGFILYTYEKDPPFVSVCVERCAHDWPPATAIEADTDFQEFTILVRPDGRRQWAYNGKPLYRSRLDQEPGVPKAIGTDGVWHVVRVLAHFM